MTSWLHLQQQSDDQAWTDQLGPAYTQSQVATLLGKTKQAVSSDRTLLRLTMRSGKIGYPVFQFDGDIVMPVCATSWTSSHPWLPHPGRSLRG